MSQQGEAAEQIVNMATNVTVKGVECVANLTGKGALSLATFLIAALKDQKRTKGKARMRAFDGKPTKVFVIKAKDMKQFAEEARKYGILYAAIFNRKRKDGLVDVVVNANDAAKVNRIADRFALSTVDIEKIRADIQKTRESKGDAEKERTNPAAEKEVQTADEQVPTSAIASPQPQGAEHRQPANVPANPISARTEKSIPSAPTSKKPDVTKGDDERSPLLPSGSVRGEIQRIKEERKPEQQRQQPAREKARQPQQHQHKQPSKQKKKSKGKDR